MARNDIEYNAIMGLTTINEANSKLDGTGPTKEVYKSEGNTTINRVVIKSIQSTTEGMIRLFVSDGKEIVKIIHEERVPARNQTGTVPAYARIVSFPNGLVLQEGFSIIAATQREEKFNIIAEGVAWKFPSKETKLKQEAVTILAKVETPNSNLDGSGDLTEILKSDGQNGTKINSIYIKAESDTENGMIRIFVKDEDDDIKLRREIRVPETTQSEVVPAYGRIINFPGGLSIPKGYALLVSTEKKDLFQIVTEGYSWKYEKI